MRFDMRQELPLIAVPTVLIWTGAQALWLVATAMVVSGLSRWWLLFTIPAHVAVTYLMFTVLHDSIHRSVGRPRWVNELFGRLAMPFVALWVTYPVMRYIHLEHHRHTNHDPLSDPDAWAHTGPLWQLPFRWLTIDAWYSRFCLPRMRYRPRADVIGLLINEALLVMLIVVIVRSGYGWDATLIYLVPQRLGLAILAWFFDWLPHHDLDAIADANIFKTSRVRVGSERLMGTLLCYQNFHAVHHIDPGVPFYLWKKLWRRDEADYLANGVPIAKAWGGTLTAAEYRSRGGTDPGPASANVSTTAATLIVSRDGVAEQTTMTGDESLLEAALRAGIDVPYSCLAGGCNDCTAKLILGSVRRGRVGTRASKAATPERVFTCQSRPTSDVVHIELSP